MSSGKSAAPNQGRYCDMGEDDEGREGRVAPELLARQAAAGAECQAFEATSNARLAKGAAKINPRKI